MAKFMVLSLPRSRSCWLSYFLSYRAQECGHDLLVHCGSIGEFEKSLASYDGSCETAAMVGWKIIKQRYPQMRMVVVKRPVEEVLKSLSDKGYNVDPEFLMGRAHMLDAVSNLPGVLTVNYCDLALESTCKEVFEFCLRQAHDHEWWEELDGRNIQIDLKTRFEIIQENAQQLEALNVEVFTELAKLGSQTCLHLN